MTHQDIVEHFSLEPHPEGGFFKETYRSSGEVESISRNYSTAIYFLLPKGHTSKLHRIASDEVWHFYLGGPLELVQISPEGDLKTILIGNDVKVGHKLQYVVPAGYWFGAKPLTESEYCFVGCTVSPGFDFQDFEMGDQEQLIQQFPQHQAFIKDFT